MADESFGERTEQATGKRRAEARKNGQVAQSREIPSVAVLLVALSVIYVLSTYLLQRLSWVMVQSFQKIGAFSLSPENILGFGGEIVWALVQILGPILLARVGARRPNTATSQGQCRGIRSHIVMAVRTAEEDR